MRLWLEYLKHWLHEWGDLVLTVMIAWAAIMQWMVGRRLFDLQRTVEDTHRQVNLFCRIAANFDTPRVFARLQVSNLSSFAVWLEGITHKFALDGESKERSISLRIQEVLDVGKTYMTTVSGDIESLLKFEQNKGQDRLEILKPASFTIRVDVRYWANGSGGQTSTPRYLIRTSETGLERLEELGEGV